MKTIFFCGHESRYGAAHFDPVIREFDVVAVVAATDKRWAHFRRVITGVSPKAKGLVEKLKQHGKTRLRRILAATIEGIPFKLYSDIHLVCARHKIPLLRADDVNDPAFVDTLRSYDPSLVLSAAYPQIFSAQLLRLPRVCPANFHPSLLPRCRGANPVFWSIATGEEWGGVTAHIMTEKIDEGDTVAQIAFPISDYYWSELYNKVLAETPKLVSLVREFFETGKHSPTRQSTANVTYFRNDREIHHRLFWNVMSGRDIYNLIRTEQAFCYFRNQRIQISRAKLAERNRNLTNRVRVEPGTIVDITDGEVFAKAQDACLVISLVSKGGRYYTSSEWVRRERVRIGDKLC